jgi:hypothetical protein
VHIRGFQHQRQGPACWSADPVTHAELGSATLRGGSTVSKLPVDREKRRRDGLVDANLRLARPHAAARIHTKYGRVARHAV